MITLSFEATLDESSELDMKDVEYTVIAVSRESGDSAETKFTVSYKHECRGA